jgi:hypothetical protein
MKEEKEVQPLEVVTIAGVDENSTLTRKSNISRLACFLSYNGRCMLPRFRHKTSIARREAKGTRREEK